MILTIGDSFTYGAELDNREQDAWPYLLGRELDFGVYNLAVPGGSNDRMFRVTIDRVVQNNYELVICAWTEPSRLDLMFGGKELQITSASYHHHTRFPWIKQYYAEHYDVAHATQTWLAKVLALQDLLKQRRQKYVFVSMDGHWDDYHYKNIGLQHMADAVDKEHYLGWPHEGFTHWQDGCPLGPNGHPLELGHQRIADKIYEHIRNKQWFS
tara:strand:- start:358 stop:993 length:636 start_codon:yes stop_codon:yes gene_type:complete